MTISRKAHNALFADIWLADALKAWGKAPTGGNARKVLDALTHPAAVWATKAEIALWQSRLDQTGTLDTTQWAGRQSGAAG